MRVCKFGGSSLADAKGFGNAASIIASNPERRVAVFSAPGARGRGDEKITDILFRAGERAQKGRSFWREQKVLTDRFCDIEDGLTGSNSISMGFISSIERRIARSTDELVSMGEEFSCTVMAEFMRRNGINAGMFDPATDLPVSIGENGNVFVAGNAYMGIRTRLVSLLGSHEIVCAPGFYGVDETGERRLFARGGSDYTATVLSIAVRAECCEKFTDVNGVMDRDPRVSAEASVLSSMAYDELLSMTGNGCGVVQHEAVELMRSSGIRMRVSSSFSPLEMGTVVG